MLEQKMRAAISCHQGAHQDPHHLPGSGSATSLVEMVPDPTNSITAEYLDYFIIC